MSRLLKVLRMNREERRDEGYTLVELLVAVTLSAVLMVSLSATIVVILRQQANYSGRLNNARSENGAGLWIPGDLASAGQNVDTLPGSSPCFGTCPANVNVGGSNAMMLTWTSVVPNTVGVPGTSTVTQTTRVSYRYVFVGTEYELIRVQCVQADGPATCTSNVVLHNLDAPPDGNFVPGVTVPDWIIQVTVPPDPAATSDSTVDTINVSAATAKNAQRVVVTVNGGGSNNGNGGGQNQISLSAGGTNRSLIDSTSVQGAPSLVAARSLCGGAITLIVDRSGSIGSTNFQSVRDAVAQFVTLLVGTPTRIKIVPFDTTASTLGATSPTWTVSYNMLDPTDSTNLINQATSMSYPANSTNWEDALYRTFYNENGTVAQDLPGTVVFFTDGVPTVDRLYATSVSSSYPVTPAAVPGYPLPGGGNFNQQAYNRANAIATQFRATTKFIGVGVGPSIHDNNTWINSVSGYHYTYTHKYHYTYTHSYHYNYTHSYHYDYSRWYHIEKGFHYNTTIDRGYFMEKKVSGTWQGIPDAAATTSTAPSSTERIRFKSSGFGAGYNYTLFKTGLALSAFATVDSATTWTAPTSGPTNQTTMLSQDIAANPVSDGTDGWQNGRLYTSPYTYWEINTAATSATAPSSSATPNQRLGFGAPYSFSAAVTASAAPTALNATSWSTTTTGTNLSLFTSQDNAGADNDSTDGWTRVKNYSAPFDATENLTTGTDSSGNSYVADGNWTKSGKDYTSPFTNSDTNTTGSDAGGAYSSSDPSWSISAKQYSSPYTNSDTNTTGSDAGGNYNSNSSAWAISAKQYSTPFTGYDQNTSTVSADKVLARLISNSDTGVPGTDTSGNVNNNPLANMFILPQWSQFNAALQAIALAQCGGTLTLQTKVGGTTAAADPFTYQKTALTSSSGAALTSDMTVVTTTRAFTSGTFDLNITDGTYVTVEIQPSNLSDLTGYTSGGWSCKAGVTNRPFTVVTIPNSTWTGIKVKVAANEAVSCVQTVNR